MRRVGDRDRRHTRPPDSRIEFESSNADTADDESLENDETAESDTAGFGYGDPAD